MFKLLSSLHLLIRLGLTLMSGKQIPVISITRATVQHPILLNSINATKFGDIHSRKKSLCSVIVAKYSCGHDVIIIARIAIYRKRRNNALSAITSIAVYRGQKMSRNKSIKGSIGAVTPI